MSFLLLAAMLSVSLCAVNLPSSHGLTHNVTVGDSFFNPTSFNAVVGDTVTWTLVGTTLPHTVTQGTGCTQATGGFNSGGLSAGGTFSQVLTTAGTLNYYCIYHCTSANMVASINVAAGNTTAAPTSTTTTTAATTHAPVSHTVNVGNFAFTPSSLTITVGDSVVFHLTAGTHNVISTTGANLCTQATNALISSAAQLAADYSVTFNQTGSYPYMCVYHCTSSQMYGVINVVAQGSPTAPPGSGAMSNKAQSAVAAIVALALGAMLAAMRE